MTETAIRERLEALESIIARQNVGDPDRCLLLLGTVDVLSGLLIDIHRIARTLEKIEYKMGRAR